MQEAPDQVVLNRTLQRLDAQDTRIEAQNIWIEDFESENEKLLQRVNIHEKAKKVNTMPLPAKGGIATIAHF